MKIQIDTDAYDFLDVHCIEYDRFNASFLITGSEQSLLNAAQSMLYSKKYFNIIITDSGHEILNGEGVKVSEVSISSSELIIHVNWVNQMLF
jgi:hypothetical protein